MLLLDVSGGVVGGGGSAGGGRRVGEKEPWLPPGSFAVDASKPHRKASNSCLRIKTDMLQCYESSPCYKAGAPFEECLNSNDEEYVTPECLWLRKGYSQCRRDLLNRNRIWQRGNRAT